MFLSYVVVCSYFFVVLLCPVWTVSSCRSTEHSVWPTVLLINTVVVFLFHNQISQWLYFFTLSRWKGNDYYTHTRTHCSMLLSDWVKVTVHPKTTAIHKMAPDVIQDFGSCKDHKLIWKDPLQTQCMHSWFQLLKKVTNNIFKSIWALGASGVIDYTRKAVRSHFMWRFFFVCF